MDRTTALDVGAAVLALALLYKVLSPTRKPPAGLPPGPKGKPVVGNVSQWPRSNEWLTFTEWGKQYGPITHASMLGKHFMVINSADVAFAMFDRKGAIYSARPYRTTFNLTTVDLTTVSAPYGPRLRKLRGFLMQTLGSNASIAGFSALLERNSARFARRVLEGADNKDEKMLKDKIDLSIAATVLNIAYGYEVHETGDDMYQLAMNALRGVSFIAKAGVFLVDVFPILRYLPAWFPGGGFHRVMTPIREHFLNLRRRPLEFTRKQVAAGVAQPSFVHEHLIDPNLSEEDQSLVSYAATSIFLAGYDTSASALHSFFLAMILYPDVQRRAQAEIDAVVGQDRLPELSDRKSLPYVTAIVKEVLRWQPIAPQGVPHVNSEDDVHDGYFIPRGSIIVPNIWGFLHDPERYNRPDDFNPSRFMAENGHLPERDPADFVFGFGRRVCPGRFFAEASLFLLFATSLATFRLAKAKDDRGVEITPIPSYSSEVVCHPRLFPLTIRPRSSEVEALVKAIPFHDEQDAV